MKQERKTRSGTERRKKNEKNKERESGEHEHPKTLNRKRYGSKKVKYSYPRNRMRRPPGL
jgi:hypothetical protein